jgi:hypothetical protein
MSCTTTPITDEHWEECWVQCIMVDEDLWLIEASHSSTRGLGCKCSDDIVRWVK